MKFSETNQKPLRLVLQFTMLAFIASGTAACSDFQRAIGTKKSSPDEFEVVVRPLLSLPPGFANTPDDIREEGQTDAQDALTLAGKSLGREMLMQQVIMRFLTSHRFLTIYANEWTRKPMAYS